MPKVSVIMPVYNAEDCIADAIDAVFEQDLPADDFELIICDDGSSDATLRHAIKAAEDRPIHVISHNHAGVSYARNRGISKALGEWIAFLDVDDCPHASWLSTLVSLAEQDGGSDLAVCGYEVVDGATGERLYDTLQRVPSESITVSATDFTSDLFSNRLMYQGYVWNKLFKRELIEAGEEPVRFHRGIARNEDRLFVYDYLKRCARVAVAGSPCYTYRSKAAPQEYEPPMATEIAAFDEMATDLVERIQNDEHVGEALHYLGKDTFRALVELLHLSTVSGDPDALWLAERLHDLRHYRKDFSDYPDEFKRRLEWAIARITEAATIA